MILLILKGEMKVWLTQNTAGSHLLSVRNFTKDKIFNSYNSSPRASAWLVNNVLSWSDYLGRLDDDVHISSVPKTINLI